MSDKDNQQEDDPTQKNTSTEDNILDDSFFNTVDDGLGNVDFKKLGEESASDIVSDPTINVKKKLEFKALPTVKLNNKKEQEMNKKQLESMGFGEPDKDDPTTAQMREIWNDMNTSSTSDFKLMVLRLEPQMVKGTKINGYLETFHLPTTIPDIIEQIGQKYGGGKFQIKIVDGTGKYVKSKTFEISGIPKIPLPEEHKAEINDQSADTPSSDAESTPTKSMNTPSNASSNSSGDDDDDDNDPDYDEYQDYSSRRRLRPLRPSYGNDNFYSPYPPQSPYPVSSPYSDPYSRSSKKEVSKDDLEQFSRDIEDKLINKVDSKLDKLASIMGNNTNKSEPLLNADVVKAFAPVVVAWMDSKSNKDNTHAGQFSDMNKQVVSLMQGMQDLVRIGDKSREDFSEKERRERENSRRETLEYQQKMEERFLEQQRVADQRHQQMLLQMRDNLENKYTAQSQTEGSLRLEYEKMREDFRQREEQARREQREREEKLREEIRIREEETRRREREQQERLLQDEKKWREELRQRDEENRRREMEWKEEIRQKEINALNEVKLKELEIMKQVREMDSQKTDMQHKLLEQIYQNNLGSRESQLHMELAVAKLTSDSESKMLQATAQMELEKIRHATQMQMSKMKNDLSAVESKKEDDPFASAMQKYLQRKLQVDMIKELNMDIDEDDIPGSGLMSIIKNLVMEGAGPLLKTLLSGNNSPMPTMPAPQAGRVVNPSPPPIRPKEQVQDNSDYEEDYEDDYEDVEVDDEDDMEETSDSDEEVGGDEFYGIDPMQEIPKVGAYFEYLKDAIEGGAVTHAEAAKQAEDMLSPPIVSFLMQIQDSTIVINQLYPLLTSMYDEAFVNFFIEPKNIQWMDKMLRILAGIEKAEAEEVKKETKVEEVKVEEKPKEEVKLPTSEKKPTAKKKRTTKKTSKQEVTKQQ